MTEQIGGRNELNLDRTPSSDRWDLPETPLTRADVPAGESIRLGWLEWYRGSRNRPLLGLVIRCQRCGTEHRHPWRWDWGLSTDIASHQAAQCRRGTRLPYWLALHPAAEAHNASVHREAHEAYELWQADVAREKATQQAERQAARAAVESALAATPSMTPFWLPPVAGPKQPTPIGGTAR